MTNEQIVQTLHYLVGSRYVFTLKAYISEQTGRSRILGPGECSSRDFDPNRVTIDADQYGLITGFSFG